MLTFILTFSLRQFIMINIYILLLVNLGILMIIYFIIARDKIRDRRHIAALEKMRPVTTAYIKDEADLSTLQSFIKKPLDEEVALEIMLDYSQNNNAEIGEKFINMGLDRLIIKEIQKKPTIEHIKKLIYMRVDSAYPVLLDTAMSEQYEISYMSFFGLSILNRSKEEKKNVVKKLIAANIQKDRMIEILEKFDFTIDEWVELLEKEPSVVGKQNFIQIIGSKEEIKLQEYSDRILRFIESEKEVKIAAIKALCKSGNLKYIEDLTKIYESEQLWEVRAAIAGGLFNFNPTEAENLLIKMTKDEAWWVRYNVLHSIALMGKSGLFILIDLSLNREDQQIADLAYYFLNANKDLYDTVKNIEV